MWRVVLLSWWLLGSLASCCPQHCRCFTDDDGYKVANCSKSGLLSGDIAPTIDILNFKNQLRGSRTKLEARIFRNFRGIQYLNLQNSSISHLPNDVFEGLSRVVRIDLSFNKIKHLNGVVFKSVSSLRYLNLRGNFLSLTPLEVIVSDTLQELDMGLCSITSIPLHLFGSAPNLRSLTLDGNFIQNIEYNVLPKGLTYLNLAKNNIVKPPINVFNSLRYLIRLDISDNPINCSCSLLVFQDTLSGRAGILENDVVCSNPPHLFGRKISKVNENQLCRDDYIKREGLNDLIHTRSNKKSYHVDPQVQSDEPLMMDESYGAREAAEVMFTNDETNQMGTHMENRLSLTPYQFGETGDSNGMLETMDETTPVSDTVNESPEADDPPQDMTKLDGHSTASEHVENLDEGRVSDGKTIGEDLSSTGDNLVNPTPSDPSTTTHADEHLDDLTSTGGRTEPTPSQDSDLTEDLHATEMVTDVDDKSNATISDVEIISPINPDHDDELSHLELANSEATENNTNAYDSYTLPTSATEPSDYSYDSQHDYYGVSDNGTSTETLGGEAKHHTPSSPEPELDEGSGYNVDEFTEFNETSTTIPFMEEKETDPEPSLETVSDDLVDVSSTTSSDVLVDDVTTESVFTSSQEPSSTRGGHLEGVETSSDVSSTEIPTESTVESSSDASSTEPVDVEITTGTSPSPEPTSEASSSTEPSDVYDEPTDAPTTDTPTESTTEPPLLPVEMSSEPSSTESSSSDLPLEEITLPSNDITEASSTTESSEPSPDWWDSDEVEESPRPSSTEASTDNAEVSSTSPPIIFKKKPKMIEPTTEASVTQDVEVMKVNVGESEKENIREDPSRVENEKENILTTGITFVIIGCLIALILILITIIACKKKKTSKKIRLPADPEAAAGTELQDMLLPKPPDNGIKVLPKNYTNGTTPMSNGKTKEPEVQAEEAIPVLAPEPELEDQEPEEGWEDKPEPIETVTARLTMLARPQTPIFIQKSLT
uniref:SLIT and NTRK-like protein 5 n=2 Tax=Lygus hesperus TaxID=30085 RepID=A0A0A9XN40_LYGHE